VTIEFSLNRFGHNYVFLYGTYLFTKVLRFRFAFLLFGVHYQKNQQSTTYIHTPHTPHTPSSRNNMSKKTPVTTSSATSSTNLQSQSEKGVGVKNSAEIKNNEAVAFTPELLLAFKGKPLKEVMTALKKQTTKNVVSVKTVCASSLTYLLSHLSHFYLISLSVLLFFSHVSFWAIFRDRPLLWITELTASGFGIPKKLGS